MTTGKVVDDGRKNEQLVMLSKRINELFRRACDDGVDVGHASEVIQGLAEGKYYREAIPGDGSVLESLLNGKPWLRDIVEKEIRLHETFFGEEFVRANPRIFDLAPFARTLISYGKKKIKDWKINRFEPHFLPALTFSREADFPSWIKPEEWFWDSLVRGKIFRQKNGQPEVDREANRLEGITVLVDTRPKPEYLDGKQLWPDDNLIGSIISEMRGYGIVTSYSLENSRFNLSARDLSDFGFKLKFATMLGLGSDQIRLERAIEFNVLSQMLASRSQDQNTNTSVWLEEYFESRDRRLYGGRSNDGGLAYVTCRGAGHQQDDVSFRFIAVL